MKMLKQRHRDRDSGHWLVPPGQPLSNSLTNVPIHELMAPAHSPVSILTNAHTTTPSVIGHPLANSAPQMMDRPRKKLSFRDPEVSSMANSKKDSLMLAPGHLHSLRDQGISNSIEDVDLEVVPPPPPSLKISYYFATKLHNFAYLIYKIIERVDLEAPLPKFSQNLISFFFFKLEILWLKWCPTVGDEGFVK